jgi:hypothetical protein
MSDDILRYRDVIIRLEWDPAEGWRYRLLAAHRPGTRRQAGDRPGPFASFEAAVTAAELEIETRLGAFGEQTTVEPAIP